MVYFIGVSCVKIEEVLVISYFLFVLLRVCLVLRFCGEKEKRAIFNENAKQIKKIDVWLCVFKKIANLKLGKNVFSIRSVWSALKSPENSVFTLKFLIATTLFIGFTKSLIVFLNYTFSKRNF